MNAVSTALVDHEPSLPMRRDPVEARTMTPMEMIASAVADGQSIEVIRELMALSKEVKAEQAHEAFDQAVAAAKAEIPVIGKNAKGHNDKRYANFAAYAAAVDPILGKHGLSYRFRTTQDDRIHVTCILSHRAGHREENTLAGPADSTGSKNAIQAVGSTLTYLQRYTLIQALGLAATDDDDGASVGKGPQDLTPISTEQADTIRKLIADTGTDIEKFCAYMKVDAIPLITVSQFQRAVDMLEKKRRQS